jgi:C1A family cysteine protease
MSALVKRRGLGLISGDRNAPQSEGKQDWDFGLLGIGEAEANYSDLTPYVQILNQGESNSCVAHAWEQAIWIEKQIAKVPTIELGSRLFGYINSRAVHGGQNRDSGTYLRTYAYALSKIGNCPESKWPFILDNINKTPQPNAYRHAWGTRGIKGYYKITETGKARTKAIRAALAAKHPVVFGTLVDHKFLTDSGQLMLDPPDGTIIGGHAMCIVAFSKTNKHYVYRVANSYGTSWRDNGYVWFTEEYLQWEHSSDFWVVSLT